MRVKIITVILTTLWLLSACSTANGKPENNELNPFSNTEDRQDSKETTASTREQIVTTEEKQTIDPFEGLVVSFEGISPFCTVTINTLHCSSEAQQYVTYSLSADEVMTNKPFSNGDICTIYAILPTQYQDLFALSSTTNDYLVENMPAYLTEITDDLDLSVFESECEDYLASITSWNVGDYHVFGTTTGYYVSSSDLTVREAYISSLKANLVNNYFSHLSNPYGNSEYPYYNRVDILYSINIDNTDRDSHSADEPWVAGTHFTRYFSIQAENVVLYPDGRIGWGTDNPELQTFTHEINSVSLDDLKNQCVTFRRDSYNISPAPQILEN